MNQTHVVSLEMAKQLKENGYPQNTEFYWVRHKLLQELILVLRDDLPEDDEFEIYSAPLSSELGEELPEKIKWNSGKNWDGKWFCTSQEIDCEAEAEINARAKMWLYLKQNNLI